MDQIDRVKRLVTALSESPEVKVPDVLKSPDRTEIIVTEEGGSQGILGIGGQPPTRKETPRTVQVGITSLAVSQEGQRIIGTGMWQCFAPMTIIATRAGEPEPIKITVTPMPLLWMSNHGGTQNMPIMGIPELAEYAITIKTKPALPFGKWPTRKDFGLKD